MKNIIWIFNTLVCLLIFSGCQEQSDKVKQYQENYEIIGTEKDEIIADISDTIYESIDRNNSEATEIIIDAIDQYGETVTPTEGRYHIGGHAAGTITITDNQDKVLIEETLGLNVYSITVDLNGSHTIHVDGFEQVVINPVPTQLSTELGTGIWRVGKDIAAGQYIVTGNGLGYVQIFEQGKKPRVFEVIGSQTQNKIPIEIKDGQKIKIIGLSEVIFEANNKK